MTGVLKTGRRAASPARSTLMTGGADSPCARSSRRPQRRPALVAAAGAFFVAHGAEAGTLGGLGMGGIGPGIESVLVEALVAFGLLLAIIFAGYVAAVTRDVPGRVVPPWEAERMRRIVMRSLLAELEFNAEWLGFTGQQLDWYRRVLEEVQMPAWRLALRRLGERLKARRRARLAVTGALGLLVACSAGYETAGSVKDPGIYRCALEDGTDGPVYTLDTEDEETAMWFGTDPRLEFVDLETSARVVLREGWHCEKVAGGVS